MDVFISSLNETPCPSRSNSSPSRLHKVKGTYQGKVTRKIQIGNLEQHPRRPDFISYISYKLHCCTLSDERCLPHGMFLYQVMMTLHFLNDVANDAESIQKSKIAS